LVAQVIRLLRANDPQAAQKALAKLAEEVEQAARLAESEQANFPGDFWASIAISDASLLRHLLTCLEQGVQGLRQEQFDKLAAEYKSTWKRYGSLRELNSVLEHYAFLVAVLKGIKDQDALSSYLKSTFSSLHELLE
jgi:hypothetical protein